MDACRGGAFSWGQWTHNALIVHVKSWYVHWKAGQSLHTIGRAFDKPHTSIHCLLAHHGGIVPSVRRRALLALTLGEPEDISRGIASGSSIREIAKRLERAASTVSREVTRHGGRPYRATAADGQAWASALRPKPCLLAIHLKFQKMVTSKLILDWSPEQVSGWLKIRYPDDESMCVSHETIYRSLFIQTRGVLKRELIGHLLMRARNISTSSAWRSGPPWMRPSKTIIMTVVILALETVQTARGGKPGAYWMRRNAEVYPFWEQV